MPPHGSRLTPGLLIPSNSLVVGGVLGLLGPDLFLPGNQDRRLPLPRPSERPRRGESLVGLLGKRAEDCRLSVSRLKRFTLLGISYRICHLKLLAEDAQPASRTPAERTLLERLTIQQLRRPRNCCTRSFRFSLRSHTWRAKCSMPFPNKSLTTRLAVLSSVLVSFGSVKGRIES